MNELTLVLEAVSKGDNQAAEELLPLVYGELRRLAAARMAQEAAGHTLQPTALVHEAWLRLIDVSGRTWKNRAHFFGAAADEMRRILIDRARRKSRLKHGGGQPVLDIAELDIAETLPDEKMLLVDEALARFQLKNPEAARVVVLKFFGGLTNEEAAEIIGVNERTIRRQWTFAKAWLYQNITEQR
jgi:RNA polymerase sigma factor (TIGR02999 family)